jgi:hypothetical protein
MISHSLLVVAQRNVHEDMPKGGLEADHQRFHVFAGFVSLLSSKEERGMYAEVEALVVERMVTGKRVAAPPTLVHKYPELRRFADPPSTPTARSYLG